MQIVRSGRCHSEAEKSWMSEKIKLYGRLTNKSILQKKICEEYESLFGKTLTPAGIYSWMRFVEDPEYQKRQIHLCNEARKLRKEKNSSVNALMPSIGNLNSTSKKEKDIFLKSEYITYSSFGIVGFADKDGLMKFMSDNKISENNMNIFKKVPFKVEYKVAFDISL